MRFAGPDPQIAIDLANDALVRVRVAQGGINLLRPEVAGVSTIRNESTDSDASNAAMVQAVFDYAAPLRIPIIVPYNARIGLGFRVFLSTGLILICEEGSEFVRTYSDGSRMFNTRTGVTVDNVYIEGLAWRGATGTSGPMFGGVFNKSYLGRLHHKGSDGTGIAMGWELTDTVVFRPVVENMPDTIGCGGIRSSHGVRSRVLFPDVVSGDDALQMTTTSGVLNKRFEDFYYVGPGRAWSTKARGIIGGSGAAQNTQCLGIGFIGRLSVRGGGWGGRLNAKSHFSYPLKGSRAGGTAKLAFASLNRRGIPVFQTTEDITLSSVLDPSWNGRLVIGAYGTISIKQSFTFDVAAKTITAASGTPFTGMPLGEFITVQGVNPTAGPNHNYTARITANTGAVLTLDVAPFANETSSAYTLSDTVSFTAPFAGATGDAPTDLMAKRTFPGRVRHVKVEIDIDDSTGIRDTAFTVNGDITDLDGDITIRNLRQRALGMNDGFAGNAGNKMKVTWDAPPTADPVSSIVAIAFQTGLDLDIDGPAYPGRPLALVQTVTEYDDEDPDVLLSTAVPRDIKLGGVARDVASGQAAVVFGAGVKQAKVDGLTVTGVSGAIAVQSNTGAEVVVRNSDFTGLPGVFETAFSNVGAGLLRVLPSNVGVPGYTLATGYVKTGTIAAGATSVTLDGAGGGTVPATFAGRLEIIMGGRMMGPDDYTTDGTNVVTFTTAPNPSGAVMAYTVRHRDN